MTDIKAGQPMACEKRCLSAPFHLIDLPNASKKTTRVDALGILSSLVRCIFSEASRATSTRRSRQLYHLCFVQLGILSKVNSDLAEEVCARALPFFFLRHHSLPRAVTNLSWRGPFESRWSHSRSGLTKTGGCVCKPPISIALTRSAPGLSCTCSYPLKTWHISRYPQASLSVVAILSSSERAPALKMGLNSPLPSESRGRPLTIRSP